MSATNQNLIAPVRFSLYATGGAALLLLLLHVIESEFDPTWRMVSEYSNGPYGLVMRLAFLLTAIATASTGILLKRIQDSKLAKAAAISFFVSAAGLVLAACFNQDPLNTKHMTFHGSMHGVATVLGIPGFSLGALLAGLWLKRKGAGAMAVAIGILPLLTFLAMLIYLFTGIPKDTGFAPGTYTGAFNRVVWVAMLGALPYFAAKIPKITRAN